MTRGQTTKADDQPLTVRHPSAATFSRLLQDLQPGTEVADFKIVSRAACGDGIASTADRIKLSLSFSQNPAQVPEQLILKTLLLNRWLRFSLPAILSLSTVVRLLEKIPLLGAGASHGLFVLIGVFQRYCPQAPDAMYEVEARFYRDIRPQLAIEAPTLYAARYDRRTRQFAVMMEDLTLRQAQFPDARQSMPLATVRSILRELATLHARYWQSDALDSVLSWVPTRLEGGMFPVFDGVGYDLIRFHVGDSASKQALLEPLGRTVKELCELNWQSQRLLAQGSRTLLHGDTHVGNSYVLPDGRGGLIDFQLLVKGNPLIDVTYYMVTALSSVQRREHERTLLEYYLEQLRQLGVVDVPPFEAAWSDYRLAALWGLVIGWLITPTANYGEAVTSANVRRTAQAVEDLETLAYIEMRTAAG